MRDLFNNIKAVKALDLSLRTTSVDGDTIDLQGFNSATMLFYTESAITDGTHTPKLQHADDDGTGSADSWSDVASTDLEGEALAAFDSDNEGIQMVGYKGGKRFIRPVITVTGSPGTGGRIGATCIKGHPAQAPVS